ncbi:hypothetical protein [Phragmitibacter flavus]|uniref:hypothetical protein n=1 Tax=Phragmitibacter flavus TaxID=2576071 RepID=UPI001F1160D5|nr:hypothetical protein [Phragmitibacter flavus]
MNATIRPHGFRFSKLDAIILIITTILATWLFNLEIELWWILPMVVGHFFLFCNVFLVWQRYELIWAVVFVINIAIHFLLGKTHWLTICAIQIPFTILFITLQIRSPKYHGIAAARLNPQLAKHLAKTPDE